MSMSGSEIADLAGQTLDTKSTAVLDALLHFEEAESALQHRLRRALGVGTSDLEALRLIRRAANRGGSIRLGDLRRRLGVSSAAATTITERLVRGGLVDKRDDPADGRARSLVLTESGRARLDDALGETQEGLGRVLDSIRSDEAERLVSLLETATTALECGVRSS